MRSDKYRNTFYIGCYQKHQSHIHIPRGGDMGRHVGFEVLTDEKAEMVLPLLQYIDILSTYFLYKILPPQGEDDGG